MPNHFINDTCNQTAWTFSVSHAWSSRQSLGRPVISFPSGPVSFAERASLHTCCASVKQVTSNVSAIRDVGVVADHSWAHTVYSGYGTFACPFPTPFPKQCSGIVAILFWVPRVRKLGLGNLQLHAQGITVDSNPKGTGWPQCTR